MLERGYPVPEVAQRLGVSAHSLYKWVKAVAPDNTEQQARELFDAKGETLRLHAQMRCLDEERDLLKSRAVLCQTARVKYRFMIEHRHQFSLSLMRRVLKVARAGFYQWLHQPESARVLEDRRLLELIRQSYDASHRVYGAHRIFGDLREAGDACGKHRIERIMRDNKIKAVRGYQTSRRVAGRPSIIAPNHLQREFTLDAPNKAWVTDITYIQTWQGWLYLTVVVDLYARKVVGWSMKPTLSRELALDSLLMAVWRCKPEQRVIVHSDQGSQFGSDDFKRFCAAHNLQPSVIRRGNCWDNAVAESFFSSMKKERLRKRIYKTRAMARSDIFDYIEVLYNRRRRHSHLGGISPEAFERAVA